MTQQKKDNTILDINLNPGSLLLQTRAGAEVEAVYSNDENAPEYTTDEKRRVKRNSVIKSQVRNIQGKDLRVVYMVSIITLKFYI